MSRLRLAREELASFGAIGFVRRLAHLANGFVWRFAHLANGFVRRVAILTIGFVWREWLRSALGIADSPPGAGFPRSVAKTSRPSCSLSKGGSLSSH
jgi:hypothetical protein